MDFWRNLRIILKTQQKRALVTFKYRYFPQKDVKIAIFDKMIAISDELVWAIFDKIHLYEKHTK